jgi:hypothetical protein
MSYIITDKKEYISSEDYTVIQVDDLYCHFLKNSNTVIKQFEDSILIYRGYFGTAKSHDTENELALLSTLQCNKWPLSDDWAGSFNFVWYYKQHRTLQMGNDAIGIYPCYYHLTNHSMTVSDSIHLMAKAIENLQVDESGVFQRMVYEYSNLGSRTIIKTVKSLLPGEHVTFNRNNSTVEKKYDDSLYGDMLYNDLKDETVKNVFDHILFEYQKASERFTQTHIALSGGMDSRLILGLVNPNRMGVCLTYGADEFYETKIAKRLAHTYQFKFENYYQSSDLWPTVEEVNKIQSETESLTIGAWNTILKNIQPNKKSNILLGDMCESLPGRNIKSFSSRDSRIKRFVNSILLNRRIKFTPTQPNSFQNWEDKKLTNFRNMLMNTEVFKDAFQSNERILNETIDDLKENLALIKLQRIPYVELFDELFEWYIHARLPMGKQTTIFDSHFDGQCPSMGLMALRTVSKIHPSLRVDYHFMDKIFKKMDVFKPIIHIPTLQSPFLPYYFPNFLRLMVWGIRNKIDQFLIRRMIKYKNYALRFRLLKSINSAALYHEPLSEKTAHAYFNKDNYKIRQIALKRYNGRKLFSEWPLSNNDIIALASLNSDLNQIFNKGN